MSTTLVELRRVSDPSPRSAPRFLYKYASSAYAPLDKDIIREMWVGGDLKDRLGIRHRKASKNKNNSSNISDVSMSDLEMAPMFREPHARSASEVNLSQMYEPTQVGLPMAGSYENEKRVGSSPEKGTPSPSGSLPLIHMGSSPSPEMIKGMEGGEPRSAPLSGLSYYSPDDVRESWSIPPYLSPDGEVEQPSSLTPSLPEPSYSRESYEMQVGQGSALSLSHSRPGSGSGSPGYWMQDTRNQERVGSRPNSMQSWSGGRAF